MDGADWLQGLLDLHRPDAMRILDFPHAAQRVSAILETIQQAGYALPPNALTQSLHLLKHRGPQPVLCWLRHLRRTHIERGKVREDVTYLHKREPLMQSPRYQAEGWPIGSGMVESANKLVMQARLKGSGMHWEASHVNPMLALRASVCNERWNATWADITSQQRRQRRQERITHTHQRQQRATNDFLRAWMRFLLLARRTPPPAPAPRPAAMVAGRPTAHHPWKRGPACLPKASAKN
ncbi:MAG TPA: hypothetical protein VN729_05350 [Ktedonobacteraceae bacterium]|nr:hypothetical protein [Ktedonobacteraceae bacterium]